MHAGLRATSTVQCVLMYFLVNQKSNCTIMDRNQQISRCKIKKVPQYSAYCCNYKFLQHGTEASTGCTGQNQVSLASSCAFSGVFFCSAHRFAFFSVVLLNGCGVYRRSRKLQLANIQRSLKAAATSHNE